MWNSSRSSWAMTVNRGGASAGTGARASRRHRSAPGRPVAGLAGQSPRPRPGRRRRKSRSCPPGRGPSRIRRRARARSQGRGGRRPQRLRGHSAASRRARSARSPSAPWPRSAARPAGRRSGPSGRRRRPGPPLWARHGISEGRRCSRVARTIRRRRFPRVSRPGCASRRRDRRPRPSRLPCPAPGDRRSGSAWRRCAA